jgi:histidyl-tRNA synthetase
MAEVIQPIRGMNDILPTQIGHWQFLEATFARLLGAYGYEEMRIPLIEQTALFRRSIGELTDVVSKEMYTFESQGGESLTLRPEATAGMVRAVISNRMLRGQRHKLWCIGPMFRYEAPQAGRYRQFHQVDVEAIGFAGPDADAELIALTSRLWRLLGITRVHLQINSLGTPVSRREYRERLVEYFRAHERDLDEDSRRRLGGNPLRILDSKNPHMQGLLAGAPLLTAHLDGESREHFDGLCALLQTLGIAFEINPRLVRGLDYYTRTVFEWVNDSSGAQNAVCSGGRYDGLVAQLGGEDTPAVGFAMGMERVVTLIEQAERAPPPRHPDVYVVLDERATVEGFRLVERLRDELPQRRFELNLGAGNFKTQFRRADRSGAVLALVVGEAELSRGVVGLKPLRQDTGQTECPVAGLAASIESTLAALDGG